LTYRIGSTDTPFLFNGRYGVQTDPNGLLYMRARYYNPYICRFINPDPIGFSGGLNWYAYADGNPVNYQDPFGLCALYMDFEYTWLDRAMDVAGGLALTVGGFVPYVGDILDAYTVVAPGSSALDRTLSSVSLGINAWTLGAAPNFGPVKRGVELITEAFTHSHHPIPKFLGGHADQVLSELDPNIHVEFHQLLGQNLKERGIPLNVGGIGGSAVDWRMYMWATPEAQRNAFDAVPETSRAIDTKYGTQLTQDVWKNILEGKFTPMP
ncbi:MAG: RHS repeat-associated core domain-containing protein, partial [Verrucomicrobiae bacterium]|nr:RHS repeat-associated core domain-containing protein [Verrucomicrobiae bacterium]